MNEAEFEHIVEEKISPILDVIEANIKNFSKQEFEAWGVVLLGTAITNLVRLGQSASQIRYFVNQAIQEAQQEHQTN